MEQSQLWEERSIEVKDFITKYAWCKKNMTYVSFIKVNTASGKEEEYEKLLGILQKKSKHAPYINLK